MSFMSFRSLPRSIALIKTSIKNHPLDTCVVYITTHLPLVASVFQALSPYIFIQYLTSDMQSFYQPAHMILEEEGGFFLVCMISCDKPSTCVTGHWVQEFISTGQQGFNSLVYDNTLVSTFQGGVANKSSMKNS